MVLEAAKQNNHELFLHCNSQTSYWCEQKSSMFFVRQCIAFALQCREDKRDKRMTDNPLLLAELQKRANRANQLELIFPGRC